MDKVVDHIEEIRRLRVVVRPRGAGGRETIGEWPAGTVSLSSVGNYPVEDDAQDNHYSAQAI